MRYPFALLLVTPFALAACAVDSAVSPGPAENVAYSVASNSPVAQAIAATPFHLEFDDFNPCNGVLQHFVFEGTQQLQSFGDHFVLHVAGTVTTDDGWVGKFNRQLVSQGTEVTWRFLDMEVSSEHQRELFTANLHGTLVDGVIVWDRIRPSLRCVGKPALQ
jgi:hypothetical protein